MRQRPEFEQVVGELIQEFGDTIESLTAIFARRMDAALLRSDIDAHLKALAALGRQGGLRERWLRQARAVADGEAKNQDAERHPKQAH